MKASGKTGVAAWGGNAGREIEPGCSHVARPNMAVRREQRCGGPREKRGARGREEEGEEQGMSEETHPWPYPKVGRSRRCEGRLLLRHLSMALLRQLCSSATRRSTAAMSTSDSMAMAANRPPPPPSSHGCHGKEMREGGNWLGSGSCLASGTKAHSLKGGSAGVVSPPLRVQDTTTQLALAR